MFDNDDMQVMFKPGGSDFLLITFGDALSTADGKRFAADTIVDRQGLNCLGFIAKSANWYPAHGMAACVPSISFTLKSFARKVSYGCSMGGYAAIKYARLLGASDVIAYCPQWSIDPAECSEPSGYQDFFHPGMAGMGIKRRDMSGKIHVFFDPACRPDTYHFNMIRRGSAQVRGWHVHNVGHHLGPILAGSQIFLAMLAACIANDAAAIHAAISTARRRSAFRNTRVLERAAARHPLLALSAVRYLAARQSLHELDSRVFRMALVHALLGRGASHQAEQAMALLWPGLSIAQIAAMRRLAGPASRPRAHLRTAHHTSVLYSVAAECLFHGAPPRAPEEAAWIGQAVIHDAPTGPILGVADANGLYACQIKSDGTVALVALDAHDASQCLRVLRCGDGTVQATWGALFMCAELDGRIALDRQAAGAWEVFRLA